MIFGWRNLRLSVENTFLSALLGDLRVVLLPIHSWNGENGAPEIAEEVIADAVNDSEKMQEEGKNEGLRMLRMDDDDDSLKFDEVFVGDASVAGEINPVPDNWMQRLI